MLRQVLKILTVCVYIHQSVEKKSKEFYEELRRYNYVTPTSYLELLMCFIKLLMEKRADLEGLKGRLAAGLDKLLTTAGEVEIMQNELVSLQPILAKTSKEADDMMVAISIEKADADQTKIAVTLLSPIFINHEISRRGCIDILSPQQSSIKDLQEIPCLFVVYPLSNLFGPTLSISSEVEKVYIDTGREARSLG